MRSLLDGILEATEARYAVGPVIVGESHELAGIGGTSEDDVQRALLSLAGPGGWDAAEYGITAEQAAEAIRAADTPANRERVMVQLRQRAISRAGLDTSTGRVAVMVAGEAARKALWHRLGVQVRDAVKSEDAINLASLDWRVEKVATAYTWADQSRPMLDVFALVRGDTGAHLGTVGNRYQVIQNREAFAFMDAVLAEHGARYETAGAIYGGAKVWLQVSLPEAAFTLAGRWRQTAQTNRPCRATNAANAASSRSRWNRRSSSPSAAPSGARPATAAAWRRTARRWWRSTWSLPAGSPC